MPNGVSFLAIEHHNREAVGSLALEFGFPSNAQREGGLGLLNFLAGLLGGTRMGRVTYSLENATNLTKSSVTVTVTDANLTNGSDTLTIGGKVLTWVASAANENEITNGANDAASAANLAAVVNANSVLKGIIAATVVTNVVTLRFLWPSRLGNLVTIATNDATAMALSAAVFGGATSTESLAARTWDIGGV